MTMVKGFASRRCGRPPLNAPLLLPESGHAAFDIRGLVVFSHHARMQSWLWNARSGTDVMDHDLSSLCLSMISGKRFAFV